MLRRWQAGLERFIQGFEERWETQAAFRTTWSIIGVLVAVALICGISGLVVSNIGAIGFGGPNSPVFGQSGSGSNSLSTFPIPSYAASGQPLTPQATLVATTTAGPPTATPVPTGLAGTPSPTPTVTTTPIGITVHVGATQQPNPWSYSQGTGTLTNFSTLPAQGGASLTLNSLDFSNGNGTCTLNGPLGQITLGSDGTSQTPIQVTFPSCVQAILQSQNRIDVVATYQGYTPGGNFFTATETYKLTR
jgi:hypothetical protein